MRLYVFVFCFLSFTVCPWMRGQLADARVRVEFNDDCKDQLIRQIRKARKEIRGAVYIVTNHDIVDALIKAASKGVDIQLKVDRSQSEQSAMKKAVARLRNGKVSILTIEMPPYCHMHHKFLVVDKKVTATGSYNYTSTASDVNYENLVVLESETVAASYLQEYGRVKGKKKR